MIDLIFLKALRDKLKGGNSKSIHLNVLPGRFAARLDLANLNYIHENLPKDFLHVLLTQAHFEFPVSFDGIDFNIVSTDEQKKLGLLSKRLNSMAIENEDNFKEHGIKTFGFGFPILIKASKADPAKIIKAPLFVWQLELIKSTKKVNSWSIVRNKAKNESGRIVDEDIHSVNLNEVLLTFLKTDEGIAIPQINDELLEDALIDKEELLEECYKVIKALNANISTDSKDYLERKFNEPLSVLPEASHFDSVSNNTAYIHFGGVFGLFKAQKESIITDIDKLIERFDHFDFENLKSTELPGTPFSAIDTDPSQQEILNTLSLQPKKIIQGPPGTGKSQSLTALITNALSNNLKCLVVCEKKTALEVIKNNLVRENAQLGDLAAVIEDISKDRDRIINSVRDRINNNDQPVYFNDTAFSTLQNEVSSNVKIINKQHLLLDKKIYQGKAWTELVGEFLKRKRSTDYKILQDKLDYKWFAFANDENEMEQISISLKNAKRYFEPVNTLSPPLFILHDDVFQSSNLSATQLKLENIVRNYLVAFPLIENAIINHQELSVDWKLNLYSNYTSFVKSVAGKWIPFIMAVTDSEPGRIEELFDHEKSLKFNIIEVEKLLKKIDVCISGYNNWLEDHYSNYYNNLEKCVEEYEGFIKENTEIYGHAFLKNSPFDRFITNGLSVFSKKQKILKTNRVEVTKRLTNIRETHLSQDYIDHQYITDYKRNNLNVFVENINSLKSKCKEWFDAVPVTIKEFTEKIHSRNLHPGSSYKPIVSELEKISIELADELSTAFELYPSSITFENLHDIHFSLDAYKKELTKIQNELEGFILFYQKHASSYKKIVTEVHKIEIPFKSDNIFREPVKQERSLEKNLLQLKEIESRSQIIQENLQGFRDYYNWRTFYNEQPELNQKVITSVIIWMRQ